MIFTSISLNNFKQYKDHPPIQLVNKKNNENIILFYGPNGSGKTTLLEALRFAILGKRLLKLNGFEESTYKDYLRSIINEDVIKRKNPEVWVELGLELENGESITINRSVRINKKGEPFDCLQITNGSDPLELIPMDYWEDFLSSIVPTEISEYFFLDGEGIKQIISGKRADELIKNSAKDLMGLTTLITLENDLTDLSLKFSKRQFRQTKKLKEIEEKRKLIKNLVETVRKYSKEIELLNKEIKKLATKSNELEKEARLKLGEGAKAHKTTQTIFKEFLEDEKSLNDELSEICEISLPITLTGKLAKDLNNKIKNTLDSDEIILSSQDSNKLEGAILISIKKSKDLKKSLQKKQLDLVLNNISQCFSNVIQSNNEFQILRGINKSQLKEASNWLTYSRSKLSKDLKRVVNDKEKLDSRKAKLLKKKKGQINDSLDKFIKLSGQLRESRLKKEAELISLRAKIDDIEAQRIDEVAQLNELETRTFESMQNNEKLRVCLAVKKAVREYSKLLISKKTKDLSWEISDMHKLLAQKKDQIKNIQVLPKTLDIVLKDIDGRRINPARLSTGESEIYSLSVLWGLEKISNRTLPIIIDAPFEKLDKKHVSNLVTKLLPKVSHQVLLFAHDRELDPTTIGEIKPKITKLYSISRPSRKTGSIIEEKKIKSWRLP